MTCLAAVQTESTGKSVLLFLRGEMETTQPQGFIVSSWSRWKGSGRSGLGLDLPNVIGQAMLATMNQVALDSHGQRNEGVQLLGGARGANSLEILALRPSRKWKRCGC